MRFDDLDFLTRHEPQRAPSWEWMKVASIDPLKIQGAADIEPLRASPSTLVSGLLPGMRVLVLRTGTSRTIVGTAKNAVGLLGDQDLDYVRETGHYVQGLNLTNGASLHYPFNQAGWLEVVNAPGAGAGGLIFQTYQEYGRSGLGPVRRAWRSWSRGSWSAWQVQNAVLIDAGQVSITPPTGGGWGEAYVSFTVPFTESPTITLTAHSGAETVRAVAVGANNTQGFTARMDRSTQVRTTVSWQAIQKIA